MGGGCYFCSILTKHGLCCQILLQMPNTKCNENPSGGGGGRSVAPGRTEITKLIVAFRCRFEHAHTVQHFDHKAYLGPCVKMIVIKPRFF
jgi:hypothetical protein